jgi:hypothetical protein
VAGYVRVVGVHLNYDTAYPSDGRIGDTWCWTFSERPPRDGLWPGGKPTLRGCVLRRGWAATIDVVFGIHAKAQGTSTQDVRRFFESRTHHQRSTTLTDLSGAAVFLASDLASGFTGAVLNLTAGEAPD